MMNTPDFVQSYESARRAAALLAFAIANDSRYTDDALGEMRARGHKAYSLVTTKATEALTAEDAGVALLPLRAAMLEQAINSSILGRLDGVVTMTLTSALRVQTARITGSVVSENATKPVSSLAFSAAGPPFKSVAQIVGSSEFFRAIDEATQQAITRQLSSAAAVALDEEVMTALTTAAGSAQASADPGVLLAAIAGGAPARPALIGDFASLAALAGTVRDLRELGVQIVLSPAATGRLFAVDASMIAVALDPPIVQVARHADIVLDDGGSPGSSTTVSLFQQNMTALRSELWARFAIAPGAVAYGAVAP